jgi:hypothetical protein
MQRGPRCQFIPSKNIITLKVRLFNVMPHARRAPSNHEKKGLPLPLAGEEVVRVARAGFPLTLILSPGGERRYFWDYFLIKNNHTMRNLRVNISCSKTAVLELNKEV